MRERYGKDTRQPTRPRRVFTRPNFPRGAENAANASIAPASPKRREVVAQRTSRWSAAVSRQRPRCAECALAALGREETGTPRRRLRSFHICSDIGHAQGSAATRVPYCPCAHHAPDPPPPQACRIAAAARLPTRSLDPSRGRRDAHSSSTVLTSHKCRTDTRQPTRTRMA